MVRRQLLRLANSMVKLRKPTGKPIFCRKKINKVLAGLESVRTVKNCDLLGQHFQDLGHSFLIYQENLAEYNISSFSQV